MMNVVGLADTGDGLQRVPSASLSVWAGHGRRRRRGPGRASGMISPSRTQTHTRDPCTTENSQRLLKPSKQFALGNPLCLFHPGNSASTMARGRKAAGPAGGSSGEMHIPATLPRAPMCSDAPPLDGPATWPCKDATIHQIPPPSPTLGGLWGCVDPFPYARLQIRAILDAEAGETIPLINLNTRLLSGFGRHRA